MRMLKIVLAAAVGNTLEIYDLVIYGFFAVSITEHFFPQQEQVTGLVSTFAVFFIGYLARPIGALFFGRIGDQLGRKPALLISIWLMALSTCGIGLIPDYDTIGGPILLLLNLRIFQGISCGGELTGSVIFIVEHAPKTWRGFYGSLSITGLSLGILFASLFSWLTHLIFNEVELTTWAWRLPFFLGALGGIIGWFARRAVPETDLFEETYRLPQSYFETRREVVKQLRPALKIMGIELFSSVLAYLIYVFLVTYMTSILQYTPRQALSITTVSIILLAFLGPCVGKLSDHVGRRPIMAFGIIGSALWMGPYFLLLQQQSVAVALLAQMIMTLFAAAYLSINIITMVEIVPVHMRFSVVAVAHAVTVSLFGGMTPLIATLLIKWQHAYLGLAILVSVAALISLFTVYKIRETRYVPKSIEQSIQESIKQIARNRLANGDSVEKVAAITGLSEDEVTALKP